MPFHSSTARRGLGVVLAAAMATLLAACSESGSGEGEGEGEGAARSTGKGIADAPAPHATAPDEAAFGTPPAAAAADPAITGAAGARSGTVEGATVGGDGSDIVLAPLSSADIDGAALTGELACSFSIGDAPPLLLAMGDAASQEPSRGVVKVGDYVEAVAAPGGFDAMQKGTQFSGAGKTIRIALTGAVTGAGESPPAPATLTYDRADGARRSVTGRWQCGP